MTQFAMPLVAAFFAATLGLGEYWGWRASMFVAGFVCLLTGVAYFFLTQDTPRQLRRAPCFRTNGPGRSLEGAFLKAARDPRVWVLFPSTPPASASS